MFALGDGSVRDRVLEGAWFVSSTIRLGIGLGLSLEAQLQQITVSRVSSLAMDLQLRKKNEFGSIFRPPGHRSVRRP